MRPIKGRRLWAMGLALMLSWSAFDPAQAAELASSATPQRVITLLPSLTESVCALGACSRLVGVDRHSNWPPEVNRLPKLGALNEAQLERIVQLRPDLVLLDSSTRLESRLRQLGIHTVVVDTVTYEDIARALNRVAEALGEPHKAAAVIEAFEAEVEGLSRQTRIRLAHTAPRVYFEVDPSIYAAGEASFIGRLLHKLGARNIVPASLGPFPKINPEFVVRQDPDLVFVSDSQKTSLAGRPGWGRLRAVQNGWICGLDKAATDRVVRPSPYAVEGLRILAACLEKQRGQ